MERGLGVGASRRPQPARASNCRADWGMDPDLESGFNPVLEQI
jgi:hypothetical protein